MENQNEIDYEHLPAGVPMDETDVNLRAYLSRLSNEHLAKYDPAWTDEAYLRFGTAPDQASQQVLFWAGRTPNPYQSTELAWDNDLRFNGFTLQYAWNNPQISGLPRGARGLFATGGA